MPGSSRGFSELEANLVSAVLALDPIAGTNLGLSGNHNSLLPPTDQAERILLAREVEGVSARLIASHQDVRTDEGLDAAVAVAGARSMAMSEGILRTLAKDPGWYVSTALDSLYGLLLRRDLSLAERNESALARLIALPGHLQSARTNLHRPAGVLVENAVGDTDGAIGFCNSELRRELLDNCTRSQRASLQRSLDDALSGLAEYRAFLAELGTARSGYAAGRQTFEALVRDVHLLPFGVDQLTGLGTKIANELSRQLASSSAEAFGTSSWWEPVARLSASVPTPDQLFESYRHTLAAVRAFVNDRSLFDLTAVPDIDVVPTPPFARTNLPFAAYVGAPPFGSGKAEFWVTPIDHSLSPEERVAAMAQHHLGRMLVACIHEAYPGHHVEYTRSSSVQRPLRHLFRSTVFTEGWAFYCEHLLEQSGFLADYAESRALRLAMLRDQLWRALRIKIDVGLHCEGLAPAGAASLLAEAHVMTLQSAEAEIRYSCGAPTQPLSYMVGRKLFEELFAKLRRCPERVDSGLAELHGEVLSHGPVPLTLLAEHLGVGSLGLELS